MLPSVIIITSGIFVSLNEASILSVIGLAGDTVTLPCKYDVKTNGISNICWGRDQSLFGCEHTLIATDGLNVNFRQSQKYSLDRMLHTGDVSLTIKTAQKEDSGFYSCRIEIPGIFNDLSYTVFLIVTNDLNSVKVTTGTGPPFSAEKPAGSQDDTSEFSSAGSVSRLINTEETLQSFILTVLRVGAVIFIPGLIIAFVWKLQCSSGKENTPTQQQNTTPINTDLQHPV